MATSITTRAGKGSALTHNEVDANFNNLKTTADAAVPLAGGTMTGDLAFSLGKGIDFSANSHAAGMTSEKLTWYEEGTWTPTITATTGTFTSVSATGEYTRIGNQVTVHLKITITNPGTASGQIKYTLPFTAQNKAYVGAAMELATVGLTGFSFVYGTTGYVYLYNYTGTVIDANYGWDVSVTYFV